MRLSILAISIALSAAFGQAANSAGALGSIEGAIVNGAGNLPLANAAVVLTAADGRNTLSVMTSPDGRFVFRNVEAGNYRLSATRRGFVDDGRGAFRLPVQAGESVKA